jgi:DNA-binding MarR family transcriptional regulator
MTTTPMEMRMTPATAPADTSRHDALDDALVAIRRVLLRPGYRARLLDGLPGRVELATLRLLRTVQRSDGAPSIGEVAEVLTVDPSTASRVVDRAVESGLLERRACSEDRRRARLHLTATGTELLDRATDRRRELLAEVTSDWSEDELDQLVRQLTALIEGFDRLEGSA